MPDPHPRCSVRNGTATKGRFVYFPNMTDGDPELERLLEAERSAFARYERLRGYPGDVQAAALAIRTEATEAVREYRLKHP
jgi:hypothetical protein